MFPLSKMLTKNTLKMKLFAIIKALTKQKQNYSSSCLRKEIYAVQ